MPLEIRELNIQVNVGSGQQGNNAQADPQGQQGGGGENKDQGELVKQCLEEMMDVINKQKER
jgi:hypothetical protein